VLKIRHQVKNPTNCRRICNLCKIPRKYQYSRKTVDPTHHHWQCTCKHTSFSANSAILKLPKPVDNDCAFCLPRFAIEAQHW